MLRENKTKINELRFRAPERSTQFFAECDLIKILVVACRSLSTLPRRKLFSPLS